MAGYLNEIKENSNKLEHLLKLVSAPDLTEEEKNLLCSSIENCIDIKNTEKNIDDSAWKKNLKNIIGKLSSGSAANAEKIDMIKKTISDIQWRESQVAYLFNELNKLAQEI